MPANIAVKAALADVEAAHRSAVRLTGVPPERISQIDVFFKCARGRLKLRILAPDRGELIHYHRVDSCEARRSDYTIAPTTAPHVLLQILRAALPELGVVRKTRYLYLLGQTRIHIDEVEGLGSFLEFEVVLEPGQSEAEGRAIAAALIAEFGIRPEQMVPVAYFDLQQVSPQA